MSAAVLLAVLLGAFLHASWNVLVKLAPDKDAATAGVFAGGALVGALFVPFLPVPAAPSWPYLAASVAAECLYALLLARAYRAGDFTHTYPLMRGTAPLVVACASGPLLAEHLSATAWAGISLISGGILALVIDGAIRSRSAVATGIAITNALVIASYTMIDGAGARLSGSAFGYTVWMFVLSGLPWLVWLSAGRRHPGRSLRSQLGRGLAGGACSLAAYGVAVWAMTRAPVAMVAAARECSIVFGTVLAVFVLHERRSWSRVASALAVTLGVIAIRLA